ncbi:MAG TPA: trehalase-like domain-containing protein, partial [Geomonas sp.]|nr:trehalase-like domain-containing protein [Geomonas sp.]
MVKEQKGQRLVAYPPIERHGVIGDRRTAALVAADGTVDWLCLPDYDGDAIFGSVLDVELGGFWRIGPREPVFGRQRYLEKTAVLVTEWDLSTGKLELCDAMPWPDDLRQHEESGRCILRRVRCLSGRVAISCQFQPRPNFQSMAKTERAEAGGLTFWQGDTEYVFWSSLPVEQAEGALCASLELREGEVHWAIFGAGGETPAGSAKELEA